MRFLLDMNILDKIYDNRHNNEIFYKLNRNKILMIFDWGQYLDEFQNIKTPQSKKDFIENWIFEEPQIPTWGQKKLSTEDTNLMNLYDKLRLLEVLQGNSFLVTEDKELQNACKKMNISVVNFDGMIMQF